MPGNDGRQVVRIRASDRIAQRCARHALQRFGAKSARVGALHRIGERRAVGREQPLRHGLGDPSFDGDAAGVAIRGGMIELRRGPAVHDRVPAIRGGLGLMNDDGARGAAPRGLFELVGPASVVGHRPAAKQCRIAGGESRIVDEDHRGLAVHVDARVVVPAVFRRGDAVSYEHHRARIHRFGWLHALGPDDHVLAELESVLDAASGESERGVGTRRDLDHRHFLQKARAVAGLQAQLAKLGLEVVERELFALGARLPAAEFV